MFDGIVRTLTNVKHVLELKKNLVSLSYLEHYGFNFSSRARSGVLNISIEDMVVIRGRRMDNNLYGMVGSVVMEESDTTAMAHDPQGDYKLWHYHLGHMSEHGMKELSKNGSILDLGKDILGVCEPCQMEKQRRIQFSSNSAHIVALLELVHTDVWGPSLVLAQNGVRYFLTLIDDFLRKVWVYFLRKKSEVFLRFKVWKAEVEKEQGWSVKCLRSDNSGEFTNREF